VNQRREQRGNRMSSGLRAMSLVDRFDRLLGCLLAGEARPFEVTQLQRVLRVGEISLRLTEPILRPRDHPWMRYTRSKESRLHHRPMARYSRELSSVRWQSAAAHSIGCTTSRTSTPQAMVNRC